MAKRQRTPKPAESMPAGWAWLLIVSVVHSSLRTRRFDRAIARWQRTTRHGLDRGAPSAWAELIDAAGVIAKRDRNRVRRSIGLPAVGVIGDSETQAREARR